MPTLPWKNIWHFFLWIPKFAQHTLEIRLVSGKVPETGGVFFKVVYSIQSEVFIWLPKEKENENTVSTLRFQIRDRLYVTFCKVFCFRVVICCGWIYNIKLTMRNSEHFIKPVCNNRPWIYFVSCAEQRSSFCQK